MDVKVPIIITNLITGNEIAVDANTNTANLPLFNTEHYKIRLNVNASDNYRKIVRWDFGDGTIVSGITAEHFYSNPGNYKISCTFYDIFRNPIENLYTVNVVVKEVIPLKLKLADSDVKSSYNYSRSKISNLFTIESYLSSMVVEIPSIAISRINDKENQNNYFDVNENEFYHLDRYWTFLDESTDLSISGDNNKIILSPVKEYTLDYTSLYVDFVNNNGTIVPYLYAYISSSSKSVPDEFEIYNPMANVNNSYINNPNNYYSKIQINKVYFKSDISETAKFCGAVASSKIWYKDDYIGSNTLYFSYDTNTLKFNDTNFDSNATNIPPYGVTITIKEPASEEIVYGLSSNGIISEVKENTNSNIIIDKNLYYNFYLNYTIEMYFNKFIKNDSSDNRITYSILKDETYIQDLYGEKCTLEKINDTSDYMEHYSITPTDENFNVHSLNNLIFTYNDKLKDLDTIIMPQPKYDKVSFKDVYKAYTPHMLFDDTNNLEKILTSIFETDDFFKRLNIKAQMFLNDTSNHKTCYINYLQGIMEMFSCTDIGYNINAFNTINDLKELTRIMSMNYCDLFGQSVLKKQDIAIVSDNKGKCVGDRILPNDIIACDKFYNIVGIIRNNIYYPNKNISPFLILFDTHSEESKLVSLVLVKDYTTAKDYKYDGEPLENEPKYFYSLNDYNYQWGWGLNLPEEAETSIIKANIIDGYYSIYLYNKDNTREQCYNFIDENTFPLSKKVNEKYITVDEWKADYDFVYDCILKLLILKLSLSLK